MTRGEYTRLGGRVSLRRRLVDESIGSGKRAEAWKKLRNLVKRRAEPSFNYGLALTDEPIQLGSDCTTSRPMDAPCLSGEDKAEPGNTPDCIDGHISIEFSHNHACREFGEDEDFRCLWLSSSEDEDDSDQARGDAVSVASWPRPA